MRPTFLRAAAAAALAVFLTACGGGAAYDEGHPPYPPAPVANPNPRPNTLSCSVEGLAKSAQSAYSTVCMLTSSGEIVFELYTPYAPVTVNNFLRYVADGAYSNTLFHRVDRDFVIQGGGYTSGMVERRPTYGPIVSEANNGLANLPGTLAMARRSDPNSATNQFFINVRDNPGLDYAPATSTAPAKPGYTVFGRVISGMATVEAINAVPTYRYGDTDIQPQQEVLIYWVQRLK
ncbi:peptidyl-prolyl cis-trans isomerase A (cyclophilin A) [Paucibacter oligotrophus]|uniref:Peptidyl-prolyl cis-trans isomerase n=1 Tax=Roseateles oligotrophus TaxID=1769250 RepID=A0A840L9P7_9BURK|nr:peptidylprolyl isomerase [Roseateles oligotrophus]MBB4843485.1 peptidyl-prolyl cis-trans isomerase A (cyclophilin A) [Roseateles oligotrophus]